MNIEALKIGRVNCDFIEPGEFLQLARLWLRGNEPHHVVTLNPEMVVEAETNADFRNALLSADIRVPDGSGLIWAHWYIRSKFWTLFPSLVAFSFRDVERITGVDTVINLSRLAQEEGASVYLLGGTAAQVEKTATLLKQKFPNLTIYSSRDHAFALEGPPSIVKDIQDKAPSVLFVAYGAPKQTVWIARHHKNLPAVRIAVGVGGAFAILSEEKPRAPQFFRRLNLEWLWRLILEPSRLPRIWRAVVEFPQLVQRQKNSL